jgi:valyl-tRNA synthetase
MEIPKAYIPGDFEDKIYKNWEDKGLFNPDTIGANGEPFAIVLPPPNVTGTLHLGHASMLAIEDLFIRYKRMNGFDTLWVPGTDHAGIATQNVVEKKLWKDEQKTRHDIGRESLLKKIDEHIEKSKNTIHEQVRKMGSSLDWSREAYTMDKVRGQAVRKVFKMMYDDGLIYRGYRIVNWCPRCQTVLADDEVKYKEEPGKFYTFKYDKDFPITIATTRPETKVGDTAIAVNPTDERYQQYVGQTLDADFLGIKLKIKIIADENVDINFGTGALGVTPAHSAIDFEMAQKNKLEIIKVIDENGVMTDKAGRFAGMKVADARAEIIAELEKRGLLEKTEEQKHNLSLCYRCSTTVEPLTSDQWFIDVNKKIKVKGKLNKLVGKEASLKELSLAVVREKQINIIPDRFEKTYFHWMENLHDWCISRQLWFGHQIPVWNCEDCNEQIVTDKSATEVFVLRHGQAIGNEKNRLNSDVNRRENVLTEKGKAMAADIAEELKKENFDVIFCSDFVRAEETAIIVGEKLKLQPNADIRLREVGVGEFENRPQQEMEALRAKDFEAWHNGNPQGIESFTHLKNRVHEFLEEVTQKYAGKKILIVAHGDVARVAQGFGTALDDLSIFNLGYPDPAHYIKLKLSPVTCKCGSKRLTQESDTLDTWFSSGLWTFSTLLPRDWDGQEFVGPDIKRFHPTAVLETGYDILFFWVARMIMMTTYVTGEIPFENVYLHGLIRDKDGEKMSKSKPETAIDPLDAGKKYGFDAVRLSLLIGNSAGNDTRLYDEKIEGYRNFVNKLWNISRYILLGEQDELDKRDKRDEQDKNVNGTTPADKWILSRFNRLIVEVTKLLDEYNFSQAGELLREFTWNEFADWYLEIAKVEKNKEEILIYILKNLLKLWHPFVPFVTEAIWSNFSNKEIMISDWPKAQKKLIKNDAEKEFEQIRELVTRIRNLRAEYKIDPVKKVNVAIIASSEKKMKENLDVVKFLARIERVEFVAVKPEKSAAIVVGDVEIYILLADILDFDKEKERLSKEKENLENYIVQVEKKLSNQEFVAHAPKQIVDAEQAKIAEAKMKLAKTKEQLATLN